MANNYIYPHIEFQQSTVGAVPQNSTWRSTIGVVGQFRRGPLLYRISGSQDFNRLYGSDLSPGARAVRQMLAQGVTDILISRATSQETASSQAITFYGLNAGLSAKVGYEGQVQQYHNGTAVKTTGIRVDVNYIGEALSSVNSFGTIHVDPKSQLNRDLEYSDKSRIVLSIEDRISNSVSLSLTSSFAGTKDAYVAVGAATYTVGATGTLASLNANLTPQGTAAALATGDSISTGDGGLIQVTGNSYAVLATGTVAVGSIILKTSTLNVSNVLARLDVGSKIYFNYAEIATVVAPINPTNLAAAITVVANVNALIPSSATLQGQALIGKAIVSLVPAGVDGYQFMKVSRRDYPAVVSNLTAGRSLHSNDSNATFTSGALTVLSGPIESPTDQTIYKVLVKGQVTGTASALLAGVKVALYESPVNGYVVSVSTSAILSSKTYPQAKQWRNQLYQQNTNTLVDSYVVINEAYQPNNLKVDFLFIEPDDTVRAVDSGLIFDTPSIADSGVTAFLVGSSFTIPVVRATIYTGSLKHNGVAFETGTSAADVLSEIKTEILQNSLLSALIDTPILSSTLYPANLTLASFIKGPQANRIYMEVVRATQGEDLLTGITANDLLLNSNNITAALANWSSISTAPVQAYNSIYFTLGNQGSSGASLNLYSSNSNLLVKIVALSEGAYGNQIQVTVNPTSSGQFVLNIVDLDSNNYQTAATSETLNLSTRDVNLTTGLFNATANSGLIRAFYIPILNASASLTDLELDQLPTRISPAFGQYIPSLDYITPTGSPSTYSPAYQGPSYLQKLYLQGGADAALESDADTTRVGASAMIRAVQALESQDIAILLPAGIVIGDARYAGVIEECLGQVNRASNLNTNRRLVLQAPPNLNQSQAALYGAQLNNVDVSLIAGYCGFTGISIANTQPTAPLYAATLSLTPPPLDPAYVGNGVPINGVISVDTLSSPQYLDAITRAGVDALYFDAGLRQFKFLNGRTTSRDPKKNLITIRRVALQMMADLYINSLTLLSSQNDDTTRALVAASFDVYLNGRVAAGWIQSFNPTICNIGNNPISTQVQNKLNVYVSYTPYFPADIILVDLVQQFSLSLGN